MKNTFPNSGPGLERDDADCEMSLRDWFAGQALTGFITKPDAYVEPNNIALEAYRLADAMMKARDL